MSLMYFLPTSTVSFYIYETEHEVMTQLNYPELKSGTNILTIIILESTSALSKTINHGDLTYWAAI